MHKHLSLWTFQKNFPPYYFHFDPYSMVRDDLESDSGQSFNVYSKVKDDLYSEVKDDDPYSKVKDDLPYSRVREDDPYTEGQFFLRLLPF
jgi:hypothetical protein